MSLCQLIPKITRNYLKEGYMEKTGPLVSYQRTKLNIQIDVITWDLFIHLFIYYLSALNCYFDFRSALHSRQVFSSRVTWTFESVFLFLLQTQTHTHTWITLFVRIDWYDRRSWGNGNVFCTFHVKCVFWQQKEPFKKRWFILDSQNRKLFYFKGQLVRANPLLIRTQPNILCAQALQSPLCLKVYVFSLLWM